MRSLRVANWAVPALFAFTLFLGSFLLFLSEPIQGKMLLPWLGGAPAVWNACMLFFQCVLLLAYLYAHVVSTKLAPRLQFAVHAVVLLLPFALLPVTLPEAVTRSDLLQEAPLRWVLFALLFSIGPAFFAVAATSPLLQSWFVRASGASAPNPYALYAASNLGSLLALLGYPLLVEPELTLGAQTDVWTKGYAALVFVIFVAGLLVAKRVGKPEPRAKTESTDDLAVTHYESLDDDESEEWSEPVDSPLIARERLHWIVLGAVPSSLMLGVTTFLTTDIASIPMLWVLPLALYTLSFVMVFARYGERADRMMSRLLPFFLVAMLFFSFTDFRQNLWMIVTLHLAGFFVAAVSCHGRLALRRPAASQLTTYYFCMALGGVMGGAFNTLIAPQWFTRISEYPLMLVAAAWLTRPTHARRDEGTRRLVWPLLAAAAGAGVMHLMVKLYAEGALETPAEWVKTRYEFDFDAVRAVLVFGVPLLFATLFMLARRRPVLIAAALSGVVLVALGKDMHTSTLHESRSFFGALKVREYEEPKAHALVHGGILHGEQWVASEEERLLPRSYYHKDGPLGQIMQTLDDLVQDPTIAAIGLGAGTVAAYGHQGNSLTFYELDPNVEMLARDRKLFTYVDDCIKRWCNLKVVIGDGRLKLEGSDEAYDLIIVDAFSSDAIPVHLLTYEAMETYFSKLTASGIVAFHISNRYVNLEPVILNLATEMGLGYAARTDAADDDKGEGASTWVIVAARDGIFEKIAVDDDRWRGLEEKESVGVWRDDYANVARAMTWY